MENLKSDNEKLLQEARAERDTMLKEARELKEKMIDDAKLEAQLQGEQLIAHAKASIQQEKNAVMAELKNQVSEFSVQIAEQLVKKELTDKDAQKQLVEKLLADSKIN